VIGVLRGTWPSDGCSEEAVLHDVVVNHDGLIFRRGRIFAESFVGPIYAEYFTQLRGYSRFLVRNYVLRRGASRIPSGLWAIDNFSPGSYHHWMIDCLTRVAHAADIYPGEGVLLLPRSYARHPYVGWTLQAFPNVRRVEWIDADAKARVGTLGFVGNPAMVTRRPPVYRASPIVEVARRVGELAGDPNGAERLYLTRADASRRRAHNESDVVRVLKSHGFEVLQPDPAQPRHQVRACLAADLVVGVHGAALTNLMFMRPGGRLIELRRRERPDIFFFDHYRGLADAVGIDYVGQGCETVGEPAGYAINDADLVVDLDVLRENLQLATQT
jgi:capsular polysaccharide biosynthesis protein